MAAGARGVHLAMIPTILHIPHASTEIPAECVEDFVIAPARLSQHLAASTDHFTDELFALAGPAVEEIAFPVSRLVVDPERFESDDDEPMAARGLGVLYERGHDGQRIRRALSPERRSWYLDRWYRPHHLALESAVDRAIAASGAALIIDCHSYPGKPLAVDLDQSVPRPDGCFGTSGPHTPRWLVGAGLRFAGGRGWTFEVDRPYAGSIVPMRHFGRDSRVLSIMIEVNRERYMTVDGAIVRKTDAFQSTRIFVLGLIAALREAAEANHGIEAQH